MEERMEAIVRGRVQMVMFRDFVTRKGNALGLSGEVRNLKDGTVLVVAEGSQDSLKRFEALLRKGSLLSRVEDVDSTYGAPTGGFGAFNIAYE
jgi:acylphosphatase